jgi:hypothetical protein
VSSNNWIRQTHRWVSIAFTVAVIANIVVMSMGHGQQPPAAVTYSPLLPLAALLFTGLYLFVLPYAAKWRGRESSARTQSET